jgi:hypothetical protein
MSQLFETLKVSDLLRGASDATKTATANRLESSWSSLGLIVRQNQFAAFISKALNKVGTIIAEQFEPEVIFEIADADGLLEPMVPDVDQGPDQPPLDPQMMIDAVKAQIADLYRDDERRCYRIQIASDSMVALDQAQEKQDGLEMISSVSSFFEQMKGMIEQYPPLAGFSMALLQNVIRRYKGGEELDGIFQKAISTVTKLAQSREEAAANQTPPPDPNIQIAEMQAQLEGQRLSMDAEFKSQELYLKQMIENSKQYIAQQELELKNSALYIEQMKVQNAAQTAATKNEITAENNRVKAILDLQRLELERVATKLSETEKLMEERRLASNSEIDRIRLQMDQINASPKMMGMGMGLGGMKGRKKSGKIITDELGNPTGIEITEQPVVKVQRITLDEEGNPSGIELE